MSAPETEILFSQVREDPAVEERLLATVSPGSEGLRVLLIGSGGCTALSLLASPRVGRVQVVDPNPAQLQLIALKTSALETLELSEQLQLLGAFGDRGEAELRSGLYARLAPALTPEARAYWDARPAQVEFGLNRVGRFEETFRELAGAFSARGLEPRAACGSPAWSEVFEEVFERARLTETFGEAAVSYSMDRSFGAHFADVFARALSEGPLEENYHQHQVWRDAYPSGGDLPRYLQAEAQEQIRQLGTDRLRLAQGTFAERLEDLASEDGFDLIQISNISDWMPVLEVRDLLRRSAACLRPGGVVLGRRLNGDHVLSEVFAGALRVDSALNAELLALERSRFYREVVAGFGSA
jgi:S-adenosylmethionine:diacylglycerol 3-amino-3-carboxypropyl transferase